MVSELLYKITWVVLVYLISITQYKLWFADDGLLSYWQLQNKVVHQTEIINNNIEKNNTLFAELKSLKKDYAAIEERARIDLGLIKPGEKYIQIIE